MGETRGEVLWHEAVKIYAAVIVRHIDVASVNHRRIKLVEQKLHPQSVASPIGPASVTVPTSTLILAGKTFKANLIIRTAFRYQASAALADPGLRVLCSVVGGTAKC
jgi:hypothetical protein